MDGSDVTIEILKSIRDEIRRTNERLDRTNERLEGALAELRTEAKATNECLERLERRQTESEVRLATELTAVAHAVHEVRDLLAQRLDLRDEVKALDRRVTELERRAG